MNRPSPLVLVMLLLTAATALVGRPFLKTALIFAIVALGCAALGRFAARRAASPDGALPARFRQATWLIAGVVACAAFAALLVFQPRLRSTYAPDHLSDVVPATSDGGFYAVQVDTTGNSYVWTQQQATVAFPVLTRRPVTITVMARSAAYAQGPDAPVRVEANGVTIGQLQPNPADSNFQPFALRFVPRDRGRPQTEITFLTTPYTPKGDRRILGTMIQSITVDTSEAWSPVALHRWLLRILPALALAALLLVGISRRWHAPWAIYGAIAVCVGGVACALVLIVLVLRVGFIAGGTYFAWLLGNATIGSCFALAALTLPVGNDEEHSLLRHVRRHTRSLDRSRLSGRLRVSWPVRAPVSATDAPSLDSRRRIAADLVLVCAIALGIRLVWAVLTPPWLAPDERDHYTYVSHIVEQGEIPHPPYPDYPIYPPEHDTSWLMTHSVDIRATDRYAREGLLQHFPVTYDYGPARNYLAPVADRLTKGGARAETYSPLYYALDAFPYWLFRNAPILTRLFAARCGTAILGALSCAFAYLFAYELRRRRRWGWALGLSVAFLPMYVFDSAIINNDAAMNLCAAALVWLSARAMLRPGLSPTLALATGAVSGLTLLSKPTAFPVIVIAGLIVLIKVRPRIGDVAHLPRALRAVGMYLIGGTVLYAPWVAFRSHAAGHLTVLAIPLRRIVQLLSGASPVAAMSPPTGDPLPQASSLAMAQSFLSYLRYEGGHGWSYVYDIFIRSFWGYFGWLDLPLADWVYVPITIFSVIGLIGAGIQLVLQPERRPALLLAWGLVLADVVFLFGVVNYYWYRTMGEDLGLSGRYFFPILVPFLFLVLSGWKHLCSEHPIVLRVAPAMMLGLQLYSLVTIISHYYGVTIG